MNGNVYENVTKNENIQIHSLKKNYMFYSREIVFVCSHQKSYFPHFMKKSDRPNQYSVRYFQEIPKHRLQSDTDALYLSINFELDLQPNR